MVSKRTTNDLKNIEFFSKVMEKLITNPFLLVDEEKVYILTCAIQLIRYYEKENNHSSYIELAYYIILKYSLFFEDYEPLYDFSVNFGFYPIAQAITNGKLVNFDDIASSLISKRINDNFQNADLVEVLEQKITREAIVNAKNDEICYVAPTSFGKSSLIIEHIKKNMNFKKRIAIIVPTKSLLMQTYRNLKKVNFKKKLLMHDEMYNDEESFIAIFTQERALRLLEKNENVAFDLLYIDEAHRIFDRDERAILLLRLIKKNRMRNSEAQVMYLSPLISNTYNLKYDEQQEIFEQRIRFNVKEPEYYEYKIDGSIYKYNRYLDTFYEISKCSDMFKYIDKNKTNKTFCYLYSPKKIEEFASELANNYTCYIESKSIDEIVENLKYYIHEDFQGIEYIKKGIVYIHGKMPDSLKEYLEYKFATVPEIQFLIANKVVLEGMNFPIDSLFILNASKLEGKELTNLIGRVNRLEQVFAKPCNLFKLMPQIHFVNSDKYNRVNGNLGNKIKLLKNTLFNDEVENPLLTNFDINKEKKESNIRKCEKIRENEKSYFAVTSDKVQRLRQKMISLGMDSIYELSDEVCDFILKKMEEVRQDNDVDELHFLDLLSKVFIKDVISFIIDEEFKRLNNYKAINYYKYYFENKKRALKDNISSELAHFRRRIANDDSLLYVGESYGEVTYSYNEKGKGRKVYIDLSTKSMPQLVNIAIIKLKIEDDFLSFKLYKFFQLMLDYGLLTKEEYYRIVYGTADEKKLNLAKMGLTINVINRIEADNQLQNISIDDNNNLIINEDFELYRQGVDDFFRFELDKVF